MTDSFKKLTDIMARLRAPGGCPWDLEQSHNTLRPYLVEETYEVLEALDSGDMQWFKDELGDLLLQVVFHAEIAKGNGDFNISDVCEAINDKLIRRHPHVFAESDADTPEKVLAQWREIKQTEKGNQTRESALDGVPPGMPALPRALKLQKKASSVGFDWETGQEALAKVEEEMEEFRHAFASGNLADMADELGDVLFSLINVARFIKADPEDALRKTTARFISRFNFIEDKVKSSGRKMEDVSLEEMEKIWGEAKLKEASND